MLLSVPRYEFNLQTFYTLKVPKPIPAGTKILLAGAFDNSPRNPANPDPSKEIRWGHQSWDEMFLGYMMYTAPRRGSAAQTRRLAVLSARVLDRARRRRATRRADPAARTLA